MSVAELLAPYIAGTLSAEAAIARALLTGASEEAIVAWGETVGTDAAHALLAVLRQHSANAPALRAAFAAVHHVAASEEPASAAVARIGSMFDAAVAACPEASVAACSLGDARVLSEATAELVAWLDRLGVIGADRDVLDLGCGIGRVTSAIAPRVRSVLGLDVSAAMIAEAKRRCRAANVRFATTAGSNLIALETGSRDLALAIDTFPYLVQAGGDVAERHVADIARILRRDGSLVIANLSYRGDAAADARDARAWADRHGLRVRRTAERPFRIWDGLGFVLDKK